MGEAKTRAERRRAEREAANVTIVDPTQEQAPPERRYRQKLVDFVPEVYSEIIVEINAYNAAAPKEQRLGFDAFLNGLVVIAIEYTRQMRAQAEQAKRAVQAVPSDLVERVLAQNQAAMAAKR